VTYEIIVKKIEVHPKAGEVDYSSAYSGMGSTRFPDTIEIEALRMILTVEQFEAIRRAALEVVK
jgi:hypothetical protein